MSVGIGGLQRSVFAALVVAAVPFLTVWVRDGFRHKHRPRIGSVSAMIGFVTDFFDTLGIGSFATTTSVFRLFGVVNDEEIPGTMIVGHALPVIAQAFIFIAVIRINANVLLSLIAASLAGGWLGAGVVSTLPKHAIRRGMAVALYFAALFLASVQLGFFLPAGAGSTQLSYFGFAIALVCNFAMGALLTLGIGNYGPSLILFSLLGFDPRAAFPVMMGSAAFVAVAAGFRYINSSRYSYPASVGLSCGGIPGVLVAAYFVTSLPLYAVRWMVIIVLLYTASLMLRTINRAKNSSVPVREASPGSPPVGVA